MLWSVHVNMYAFVSQYLCMCMCISAHSLHTAANRPIVALPADIPRDGVSDTCVQTDVYVQIQYASPIGRLENPASYWSVQWLCSLPRKITDRYEWWSQGSRSPLDTGSPLGWSNTASLVTNIVSLTQGGGGGAQRVSAKVFNTLAKIQCYDIPSVRISV